MNVKRGSLVYLYILEIPKNFLKIIKSSLSKHSIALDVSGMVSMYRCDRAKLYSDNSNLIINLHK